MPSEPTFTDLLDKYLRARHWKGESLHHCEVRKRGEKCWLCDAEDSKVAETRAALNARVDAMQKGETPLADPSLQSPARKC